MPIDFATIAARFDAPLTSGIRPMIPLFARLARAVALLADAAERGESATHAYPVLRYEAGAVAVHMETGGLPPVQGPPLLPDFPQAQEQIIPGYLDLLLAVAVGAADSLERFVSPTPAMFDQRSLSDILGLVNLAFAAALTDRNRLAEVRAEPHVESGEHPVQPAGPPDTLAVTLEGAALDIMTGVLVLPVAGPALAVVAWQGALLGKERILTRYSEIETSVVDLRAAALERLISQVVRLDAIRIWLETAHLVVNVYLWFLTTPMTWWLRNLLDGVAEFASHLSRWANWVITLAEFPRSVIDSIMRFDLGLLFPVLTGGPILPQFTLGDLIGHLGGKTYPYEALPTAPLPPFPDVYQELFGRGNRERLLAAFDQQAAGLRSTVRELTAAGTTLAQSLDAATATVPPQDSAALIREQLLHSGDLATSLFPAQPSEDREPTPFEQQLMSGGFTLVGGMIATYVGEMKSFWGRRPPPTSPHILARHGRLGAVRLPRLTVRAAGREPDGPLAAEIAAAFRERVGQAYLDGRREFQRRGAGSGR